MAWTRSIFRNYKIESIDSSVFGYPITNASAILVFRTKKEGKELPQYYGWDTIQSNGHSLLSAPEHN